MTVRERLQSIFRDVFDDADLLIRDEMKADDIPGWDSLNYINLIVSIETEFGVQFDGEEIASLTCVGDLLALLAKHGCGDE
jgi:acyl carrier protein